MWTGSAGGGLLRTPILESKETEAGWVADYIREASPTIIWAPTPATTMQQGRSGSQLGFCCHARMSGCHFVVVITLTEARLIAREQLFGRKPTPSAQYHDNFTAMKMLASTLVPNWL